MPTFDRLDSCRNCGGGLSVKTVCAICDQPEQVHCTACLHYVDDPVHTECMVMDEGARRLDAGIRAGSSING